MAKRKTQTKTHNIIRNYGLMWRRDRVFWGRGNSPGSLDGRKSGRIIDFRDQIGVYVLYDETRRPVYVGQAGQGNARLFKRLRKHTRDQLSLRWSYFSWFGLLHVNRNGTLAAKDAPTKRVKGTLRSALNEIEGVLIAALEPAFNKQGAKFKGIDKYRQVPHPDADHVSLKELHKEVKALSKKLDRLKSV